MVGRKKKPKVSDEVLEEDRISQLPNHLRSEILAHLSTKDSVRTSVLSTRWRNLWQFVPELDLHSNTFPDVNDLVSFAEWFFNPQRKSWIRKLRLCMHNFTDDMSFLTRWIDAVTTRRIQHLDLNFNIHSVPVDIPSLSMYTCKTLVHLRLRGVALFHAEFVSLPCLKIMHLECAYYYNGSTLQKLISGSPVLEDLAIIKVMSNNVNVLQVRSQTLKRIDIDRFSVVIDAPQLQFVRTKIYSTKNFEIINLGFSTKLDIDVVSGYVTHSTSLIHGILTDISRVKDLVIGSKLLKKIFAYSKPGRVLQFCHLSYLDARICISDLEMLPTLLESCPKLESLILELVKDVSMRGKKKPKVMFTIVPWCLISSLKFVELKRSISGYEGEIELVRYFLLYSTILEELMVDVYYTNKAMCAFLKEVVAMPRCSIGCKVIVL